ncbi:MAG: hypothetical protein ACRDXB_04540, partial [Actinomycetes bacterium]
WWERLLAHERDFHLLHDEHTGHRHDHDAARVAVPLLIARINRAEERMRTDPESAKTALDQIEAQLAGLWSATANRAELTPAVEALLGARVMLAVRLSNREATERAKAHRTYVLRELLDTIGRNPGISQVELSRLFPGSNMATKMPWLEGQGLVRKRRVGRANTYTLPDGVAEMLAERTARARAALAVLKPWLDAGPGLSIGRPTREFEAALTKARRLSGGLLSEPPAAPSGTSEVHPHSVAAMLDTVASRPDGITLDELAELNGLPYGTVRDRMAQMASSWRLVTVVRPSGRGKNRYFATAKGLETLADLVGLGEVTVGPETARRLAALERAEVTGQSRRRLLGELGPSLRTDLRSDSRISRDITRLVARLDDVTGGGAGGLVAIGDHEAARRAMLHAAHTLHRAGHDLQPDLYPTQPRGPPARVRLVPAHLRPAGAEGVIAFAWKHPHLAPHGE